MAESPAEDKSGILIIDKNTYEILLIDNQLQSAFPTLLTEKTCYRGFGLEIPCPNCPVSRLIESPYSITIQHQNEYAPSGTDVIAVSLPDEAGHARVMLCYGRLGALEAQQWISDKRYQTILHQTHTVAFEYDLDNGAHFYSPFASEFFAGNYDKRSLSKIIMEDGVIYPDDLPAATQYRDTLLNGRECSDLIFRLKGRDGIYRWNRLSSVYFRTDTGRRLLVGTITDVDGEIRLQKALSYQVEFDALTGIWNRETFLQRSEALLKQNPERPYQVVQMDIERFKIVNELFSFSVGDHILCCMARHIGNLLHAGERYCRVGNDVFALLLSRDDDGIMRLLEQLNDLLNEYPVDFNFVLSAGIFKIQCYDGQPVSLFCDRAALAQKYVKGNYINRFCFYETWMSEAFAREHAIVGGMKQAMAQQEFLMYLQPKTDMRTETIFGAEALARWQHPQEGLLEPGRFVPVFERNGFIARLDEYIWEQACRLLRRWLDEGKRPVPISVNVSRVHLYDQGFCDKVSQMVDRYKLDPALLELEMTESTCAEDCNSFYEIVATLKQRGFTLSMDDFGTGYSSLSMLKDIPVDILKIDLHFLEHSKRPGMGREVLAATIQLAKKLRYSVVAEGVETREQVDFLLRSGCTRAQGYYYDRPLPVPEFEEKYIE